MVNCFVELSPGKNQHVGQVVYLTNDFLPLYSSMIELGWGNIVEYSLHIEMIHAVLKRN